MANYKRLNIYLNIDDKCQREVYEILVNQASNKKQYIISAIQAYQSQKYSLEDLKCAVKDVIEEMDVVNGNKVDSSQELLSDPIPKDVFDDILNI